MDDGPFTKEKSVFNIFVEDTHYHLLKMFNQDMAYSKIDELVKKKHDLKGVK
jgi:hypothetical protein